MIDPIVVEELIDRALAEDIGFCDLTSELVIPADARAELELNARQDIVVAGIEIAARVFRRRVPECRVELRVKDGERVKAGTAMGRVEGPARGLLAVERTALNFLQHLSGVATLTAQYVERISGTRAVLIDTRKTTPGLRALEKHAAWLGGARNHRLRLDDGVLIKDNHISVCGSIAAAVKRARAGGALRWPGSARGFRRGASRDRPRHRRDRSRFHLGGPHHAVRARGGHRARRGDTGLAWPGIGSASSARRAMICRLRRASSPRISARRARHGALASSTAEAAAA